MLGRLLDALGLTGDDDPATDEADGLDWTAPDAEYGGEGPTRRYACAECGAAIEGVGPDEQLQCPDCGTVFKRVLVPESAVCPDCGGMIDRFEFYPETRPDTEFAACDCGYRWESDPR
jgi:DNA-directed RNA polymerase subunit RPC12/RpoP